MRNSILRFAIVYLLFLLIFMLQKPLFMLFNGEIYGDCPLSGYLAAMRHGRPLDASLAGYLSVIPGLLLIAGQWLRGRWLGVTWRVYFAVVSLLMSAVFVIDTVLYGFWGSKLDVTPFFYFATSPGAAFASVSAWYVVGGIAAMLLLAAVYYCLLSYCALKLAVVPARRLSARWWRTAGVALITAALFIPIRGGFTVATMNLSAVYYSREQRMNHAAVNPMFSLMYSATHQSNFAEQYRFVDPAEAQSRFDKLMMIDTTATTDTVTPLLSMERPDIYLIIMESFSTHLMPSMGGEEIATGLDSIARSGLLWTNFYASSYRTDRALPAILSGYPAQPSTSIMKYVKKAESLPSICRSLMDAGYTSAYYYGGDANFTNMKAYLVSSGFETIVEDKDFPLADRMSKWGVVDHKVLDLAAECNTDPWREGDEPRFVVVQTSSSHEPFDVPYINPRLKHPAANAFAYADSCVTAFVNHLKASPRWDRSLVILVPDHYGAYPKNIESMPDRHHIPLVMTGGALARKGVVEAPASQIDIAATLLAQLGIDHSAFMFSKDMFAPGQRQFAYFTDPSLLGWVTATDTVVYGLTDKRLLTGTGENPAERLADAQSFLQTLYNDIDRR